MLSVIKRPGTKALCVTPIISGNITFILTRIAELVKGGLDLCGAPTRLLYSDAVCHRLSDTTGGYGFTNPWPKPLAGVARN